MASTTRPTFDAHDRDSWMLTNVDRDKANEILEQAELGEFFIRDSQRNIGDYVLCVKENRLSHYIVLCVKDETSGKETYVIGEETFSSLPEMLEFYKDNVLDTHTLLRPVSTEVLKKCLPELPEKYIAILDFERTDANDLPFRKNELLTVLKKTDAAWWTASNEREQVGVVPADHLEPYRPDVHGKYRKKPTLPGNKPKLPRSTSVPTTAAGTNSPTVSADSSGSAPASGALSHATAAGSQDAGDLGQSRLQGAAVAAKPAPGSPQRNVGTRISTPARLNTSSSGGGATTAASRTSANPLGAQSSRAINGGLAGRVSTLSTCQEKPHTTSHHAAAPYSSSSTSTNSQIKVPTKAVVIRDRTPNFYDTTALKLRIGDIVTVTRTTYDGQWEGTLNGKSGFFPFTFVKILEEDEDLEDGVEEEEGTFNNNSIGAKNGLAQQRHDGDFL